MQLLHETVFPAARYIEWEHPVKFVKKTLMAVLGVTALMAASAGPAGASTAPSAANDLEMGRIAAKAGKAWDSQAQQMVDAYTCASGNVCFYSLDDGRGHICKWSGNDDDWLRGTVTCSWSDNDRVESVRNNGTSTAYNGVRYYFNAGEVGSAGCIPRGRRGDLQNPTTLRSHKWESGPCGGVG